MSKIATFLKYCWFYVGMRRRGLYGAGLVAALGLALVACGKEEDFTRFDHSEKIVASGSQPFVTSVPSTISLEGCHPEIVLPPVVSVPAQRATLQGKSPFTPESCDRRDNDGNGLVDDGLVRAIRCGVFDNGYSFENCLDGRLVQTECNDPDACLTRSTPVDCGLIPERFSGVYTPSQTAGQSPYVILQRLLGGMTVCSSIEDDPLCLDALRFPSVIIAPEGTRDRLEDRARYRLFFEGFPVTQYTIALHAPSFDVLEGSEFIGLSRNVRLEVRGTPEITLCLPVDSEEGYRAFQNRLDILQPGLQTSLRYRLFKRGGQHGELYLLAQESDVADDFSSEVTFHLPEMIRRVDHIDEELSRTVGFEDVVRYSLIVSPHMLSTALGGDGGFNYGGNTIYVTFGGEAYHRNREDQFWGKVAHEVGHSFQFLLPGWSQSRIPVWFKEGSTDALAEHLGFRPWSHLGFSDGPITYDCQQYQSGPAPHPMGRCIFKHIDDAGLTAVEGFFPRLFHPQGDYRGLALCFDDLASEGCVGALTGILSYAAGSDQRDFVLQRIVGRRD